MDIRDIKNYVRENSNAIIGENTEYTKYAVVIPLIKIDDNLSILFEVRSKKMRSQPGEISLPGGRIEKNESPVDAALRETIEELGIQNDNIKVLGPTDMLITQHYKIIYTYAALVDSTTLFKPSENEVDHIFYVPVDFFIKSEPVVQNIKIISEPEEEFPYEDLEGSGKIKWTTGKNKVYFYKYNNYVIWGITAKIIHNFVEIITDKK